MILNDSRILITGACGGIGEALARVLAVRGARLVLTDRRADVLTALAQALRDEGARAESIAADIAQAQGRTATLQFARDHFGGIDVLINNAGILSFTAFAEQDPALIEQTFKINTLAPLLLTQAALGDMLAQGRGRIVNVGSIFGSIAFPYYGSYSASKAGLRAFSEALRRELDGSGIGVTYVAPRAVKTALNSPAIYEMAERIKMKMDEPATVANAIVRALEKDRSEVYLGFPEALFVRINALLPRLVDKALRGQVKIMREFLHRASGLS